MKFLKKIIKWFIISISTIVILLYIFDYDYLIKGFRVVYFTGHSTAFIDDYPYFVNDTIKKGATSSPWPNHKRYNTVIETDKLTKANKDWGTVAFVIIKNDSVWFENYYDGVNENSKTNSFSMAKSITTTLLGKAIMDGYIKSLNQPISDFYPEYNEVRATVGDLASMSSGMDWTEHYKNPFGITARLNYGNNVGETILSQKITKPSGVEFKYSSGDIQLLGMVIEKATGKRLAHYLSEKFWQPMGAVNDALWQLDDDENKLAKSYCCISSNARDFARFGKLYKDYGKWNGKQLLDSVFVAKSIKPRFKDSPQYGYGWWLHKISGKDFFMMHGLLGQYVMVQPNDNLIIVRLGHSKPPNAVNGVGTNTEDLVTYIEETYKMLGDDK